MKHARRRYNRILQEHEVEREQYLISASCILRGGAVFELHPPQRGATPRRRLLQLFHPNGGSRWTRFSRAQFSHPFITIKCVALSTNLLLEFSWIECLFRAIRDSSAGGRKFAPVSLSDQIVTPTLHDLPDVPRQARNVCRRISTQPLHRLDERLVEQGAWFKDGFISDASDLSAHTLADRRNLAVRHGE